MQAIGRQPQRAPDGAPVRYERHRPEQTTLYRLVQQHAASFIAHTEASTGSELPRFIKDEFDAFLECGILAHGLARTMKLYIPIFSAHQRSSAIQLLIVPTARPSVRHRSTSPSTCLSLRLAGHLVDHALATALCRIAADSVAPAQLLQFKVQVSHSWLLCFSSSCRSLAPGYPYVVAGVLMSDKCFCPYRTPGRCGNYKGHGTPLPFCAEVFLLAAAARGIGTDGDCCCKSVHRVEPLSQGSGCARWRFG